jgi:hypothetical protein
MLLDTIQQLALNVILKQVGVRRKIRRCHHLLTVEIRSNNKSKVSHRFLDQ